MSIFQNNPIIDWMDYMFYRITKFYLKHKEEFEYWRGFIIVSGTFAWVALSILFVIFGIIGLNLSKNTHENIILSGNIISFIVFFRRLSITGYGFHGHMSIKSCCLLHGYSD